MRRILRFHQRFFRFGLILPACVLSHCLAMAGFAQNAELEVLARVEVTAPVVASDLPAHAWLQDAAGQEYLVVICTESRLREASAAYKVLDSNPRAEDYVLASPRRPGAGLAVKERYAVLHDDGTRLLIRATPAGAEELAELGCAIQRLSPEPLTAQAPSRHGPTPGRNKADFVPDPRVGALIGQVQSADLLALLRQLSGEEPALIGGSAYTIATRHTTSGTPLQKATQFGYERLQAAGLEVSYHNWIRSGYANRNVIGIQRGNVRSNELVLITAHLDDVPSGARAPGADDNASGSAAVLTAAKLFSQFRFERTVKFILFTGEEQGLLGSAQYAAEALAAGDNIVAVFNMDMLSWDGAGGPVLRLHTRTTANPGSSNDLFLATVFTNAVAGYGLSNSLSPVINRDGDTASDHASFWNRGYTALYAEEDYPGDFNPYYHTTNDTVAHVNRGYFTAFTRAALATAAHVASLNGAPLYVAGGPLATNGQFWVQYGGVAGLSYTIQASRNVLGPWAARTNLPAGTNGLFEFQEPIQAGPAAWFYRPAWP